jgi:lipoprotein-anchoring transpeptidase ErfK/SrfK
MKPLLLPCLFYTVSSLVLSSAQAETFYNEPSAAQTSVIQEPESTGSTQRAVVTRSGQYGGGFIEFLITGNSGNPVRQPVRTQAQIQAPQRTIPAASPVMAPAIVSAPVIAYAPAHVMEPAAITGTTITPPPASVSRRARLASLPGTVASDEDEAPLRRALPSQYQKQLVDYDGGHRAGSVVIDTPNKFLYLVQPGGKALRYGIGVGRPGFEWAGRKTISMKREWPDWRPPSQMLKRRPDLPRHMAGGPDNPLGARAMYLGSSLYRIHGTNEPHTIGQAVSSGCIRMTNDDVIDLYRRVNVGTWVIVM